MARWPAPGRCKRRLAAGIGAQAAARIQWALTRHTMATAHSVAAGAGAQLVLAVDGLGPKAAERWGDELGADRVRLQGPGGLGLRLQRQLRHSFREGAQAVALIGTDLPGLDRHGLGAALAALAHQPLVLGPALDGGYWLIGLGAHSPSVPLLAGIPWGTGRVLELTCQAAADQGLEPLLLGELSDLDRPGDLSPWLG
ncbi:TIGR04282 family arsenosugar biosynthesis glycosyltransferase [Cyanobium sp. ATX 6F1]|nr:TIGR04282 family arsenosugar biosynthesis glycosyltransferase [Cyanobium sp. ATX 6F1]